ncbi:sel1 repeat family protein [Sphingobacterium sp. DN00404]|uniref:Sel1 repeat family protein n=1 Tax=Sphingobacterium micropteri TaxID=2763501 RepID=A0ABR7YRV5_9SPHI|nr:tetratricopeptide repeat protein [Sphingobacterium micropteri]MBD1433903.1 sel1 repeat family protein [Sphingobacterium micropteri]
MTKEQAYEKLELPIGTDLQVVRQKFNQMHNEFLMQIDGVSFNPAMKQKKEQQLEELKEAYAVLNESKGMDDSASLPHTERTFDHGGTETRSSSSEPEPSKPKGQQAPPPPPPPREETYQPREQAPPVYSAPPEKKKSNAGLFVGIAAGAIIVLAGAYFMANRSGDAGNLSASADGKLDSIAWESALAGGNEAAYTHYIKQHPNGIFMDAAIDSLTKLKGADYATTVVEQAQEQAAANTPTTATALSAQSAAPVQSTSAETVTPVATTTKNADAFYKEADDLHNKKRYKEAFALYRRAADLGDARAKYDLGMYYKNGTGVSANQSTSNNWFKQALQELPNMANQGDIIAQLYLGHIYYLGYGTSQKHTEAVKWYKKAADQGQRAAQNNLGNMYRYGQGGVTKDESEAVKWYLKAANQGLVNAQDNLGDMYRDGKGVAKNEAEAVKWYRKAAAQGNTSAQASMGRAYHYGLGVDKDFQQAENFYTQAAKSGNNWACERLTDLGYDIEKETKDYCRAKELYQKGIDLGQDGYAYYRLGTLHYFAGRCGGGGYAEAKRLWLIAFDKKERSAAANLGFMYYGGFGVDIDYIQAEKYLLKSLEFGLKDGFPEYRLGQIYQKGGHGVTQDTEKANEYFAIAKKKGYTGS